jgi:amidase
LEAQMQINRRDFMTTSAASLSCAGIGQSIASRASCAERARGTTSKLASYDAIGLADLVRGKQMTAAELIEDTIRKIEAINPKLNAVIHKTYDRARQQASSSVHHGPLGGVPFLVKDNATIAGIRLTRGSRALRSHVPEQTAPFFSNAERAGLILVGVTNMPEMGLIDGVENVLYGATCNPWNLLYSPGGSSGGSAAASRRACCRSPMAQMAEARSASRLLIAGCSA